MEDEVQSISRVFTLSEAPISQPEEQTAVYRCFHGLWDLESLNPIHYKAEYDNGSSSEVFISGRDFLRITSYSEAFRGDLKERRHYDPRMTLLYLDQKCYTPVYENPDDISSKIVDWKPYTPDRHLGFTAFQNEWNSIFFKPSDMPIAFPKDLSTISQKEVRFIETIKNTAPGLTGYMELSYHFNSDGALTFMEYMPICLARN